MKFKSIQTKYILLVLGCVIASALLIAGVCIRNAYNMSLEQAAENMNLTCESYMHKYDASLSKAQAAVEGVAYYATESLESIDRFATDEEYRDEYAETLEAIAKVETLDSKSIVSYYVRFSPDLLSFEKGFRYTRANSDVPFERVEILRLQDYQERDAEHVGWYYEPIANGRTTWLEPYHNANFDKQMISCVTPFYKDGVLLGVVGVDFDFTRLINDLDDLRIFNNGYAFLCSPRGLIYYHPLYDAGSYIQNDVAGFDAELQDESSGTTLYNGVSKGERVEYAFRSLTNGMRLVLRAPASEIGARALSMVRTISLLVIGVVALSVMLTVWVCRRITKPLLDLTTAAAMIASGEYDVDINVTTHDEVGVLARTLKVAATELKANAERMRQLAYKDSLTSVRNKTAYDLEVATLEDEIRNGCANFGIAVFDINDLKTANDVYGHEQGDKVIKIGCNRICMSFPHSPVFRIGGDEFVAIIRGEEMNHVEERLAAFNERAKKENESAQQPQDVVNLAVGVAFFDPAIDESVQDVFNRADSLMYEQKEAMKAEAQGSEAQN